MAKILFFDIECSPFIVANYSLWHNGKPNWILKESRVVMIGYKWAHEDTVNVLNIRDYSDTLSFKEGEPKLLKEWLKIVEQADMVVAHYGAKFDKRRLQAALIQNKLPPMPDVLMYDTLAVAKRIFKFESNSLDHIGKVLKLGRKDKLPNDIWLDVLQKDERAYETLEKYNIQDVLLLEAVYNAIKSYDTKHPHLHTTSPHSEACPVCGSSNVVNRGFTRTRLCIYQRVKCNSCGKWSQRQAPVLTAKGMVK